MKKGKKFILIKDIFSLMEIDQFGAEISRTEISLRLAPNFAFLSHQRRINLIISFLTSDRFHLIYDDKFLYWFVGSIYCKINKLSIQNLTKKLFIASNWTDYNTRAGNEVYRQVIDATQISSELINCEMEIVPFNNGLYDLKTMKFIGPDPNYYFTRSLTVDYTDSTDCPKFMAFIKEVLPYKAPRELLLTFLAYCLTPRVDKEMTQFWTGEGNNGKSTIQRIFSSILGPLVSTVQRQRLLNPLDRFSLAYLYGKLVNFCSEASSGNKMGADACTGFKRLTDERQHGENKNKDQMEWDHTTKFVFVLNDLPMITEYMDDATFRRITVIPFTVVIDKIIEGLSTQLYNEEGSQITAYILSFYPKVKTLIKQNIKLARELWSRHTNTVFQFATYFCNIYVNIKDVDKYIRISPIYDEYVKWCGRVKKKPKVLKSFIRLLESLKMPRHQVRDFESQRLITTYGIYCKLHDGKINGIYSDFPIEVIN